MKTARGTPRVGERALEIARDVVDAVQRIATALEKIADASYPQTRGGHAKAKRAADLPISDTDRAAARRAARSLGLVVREPNER